MIMIENLNLTQKYNLVNWKWCRKEKREILYKKTLIYK
jgi:hypothetical protein